VEDSGLVKIVGLGAAGVAKRLWALFLVALVVAGCGASGQGDRGAKTRVGAFAFASQAGTGAKLAQTPCTHRGSEPAGAEIAVGFCVAAEGAGRGITRVIKVRPTPGADNAISWHIIEKEGGETVSVTHQVDRGGDVVHQHQTHVGKGGGQRQFPNEWIEFPDVP
jgi:hypothetical protein